MLFLSEGWNRVISCYINSERQIKLNNYTEKDNNQQKPWLKNKKNQRKELVCLFNSLPWHDHLAWCCTTQPEKKTRNTFKKGSIWAPGGKMSRQSAPIVFWHCSNKVWMRPFFPAVVHPSCSLQRCWMAAEWAARRPRVYPTSQPGSPASEKCGWRPQTQFGQKHADNLT